MSLHVLMLPSFYPTRERPVTGVFFRDQAIALQRSGTRVDVAYFETRSLRQISRSALHQNHFQVTWTEEEGLFTMRQKGWNPLVQTVHGGLLWARLARHLVVRYIARYGKPDLIHAHNALWAGQVAHRLHQDVGIPYVVTEHDTNISGRAVPPAARTYLGPIYAGAGAVLAVSKALSHAMAEYLDGREARVVPNVVLTDFFTPPPRSPAREPYTLLTVAHLTRRKGIHVLVRAFAEAFANRSNVRLEIGGDGPEHQDLEALAASLGVRDQVVFLGALTREHVRDRMWRSHVFVLPSFSETFGVVLIEALSTGLPVIATRCGGPEEIVSPAVGRIVPAGDQRLLAEALRKMYGHPGYSPAALRKYATDRYGPEVFAETLNSIYAEVVPGAGRFQAVGRS